jgi:hypothetical protein
MTLTLIGEFYEEEYIGTYNILEIRAGNGPITIISHCFISLLSAS